MRSRICGVKLKWKSGGLLLAVTETVKVLTNRRNYFPKPAVINHIMCFLLYTYPLPSLSLPVALAFLKNVKPPP